MLFLVEDTDGNRILRGHPGWRTGDTPETSRLLTQEELVEHGFGLLVVDVIPEHDPETQELVVDPVEEWETTDTTAVRTYQVVNLPPPQLPPLAKWRFETMVDLNGIREQIDQAVQSMPEPQRTVAFNKRNHVPEFYRDDPLFDALGPALGLSPEQIDHMWNEALDL